MWQYSVIAQAETGSIITQLFPLILIFGVFYFLIIRPNQKRQQAHQALLNALKKDDEVVTSGGILGTIERVDGQVLTLRVGRDQKLKVLRTQVEGLQGTLLGTEGAQDSADESAGAIETKKKKKSSDTQNSDKTSEDDAEGKSW